MVEHPAISAALMTIENAVVRRNNLDLFEILRNKMIPLVFLHFEPELQLPNAPTLESQPMFAARPFALNTAPAVLALAAARASTSKTTTTIKG